MCHLWEFSLEGGYPLTTEEPKVASGQVPGHTLAGTDVCTQSLVMPPYGPLTIKTVAQVCTHTSAFFPDGRNWTLLCFKKCQEARLPVQALDLLCSPQSLQRWPRQAASTGEVQVRSGQKQGGSTHQ
jgi:hypothetical protein